MMVDKGTNTFADLSDATKYFAEIYQAVPESVIRDAIEYCLANPQNYPEGWKAMDLKRVPKAKKPVEKVIEGAVEIFDVPDDPRVKMIKHRDGATLLTAQEAIDLQAKISGALAKQEADKQRDELKKKLKDAIASKN